MLDLPVTFALVVDDEPPLARAVARTILGWARDCGIALEVTTCTNGKDALETVRANEAIKLVVSDVDMPGMGGLALIAAAHQIRPKLPFLFLTGRGRSDEEMAIIAAHRAKFHMKPNVMDATRDFCAEVLLAPAPAAELPAVIVPDPPAVLVPDPSKRKVLIVADDDPDGRDALRDFLEFLGFRVLTATNGLQTLQLYAAHAVDGVLTDFQMPELDGVLSLMRLRKMDPKIPCLVMSGRHDVDVVALVESQNATFKVRPAGNDFIESWLVEKGLLPKPA